MEINAAIREYLQHLVFEKGLLKQTIIDYKDDFNCFFEYFPNINDTDQLTSDDIDNFTYKQGLDELKATTISRRVSTIKNFYIFLEREGICNEIVKEVILPKKEKHIPTFLSVEEVERSFY